MPPPAGGETYVMAANRPRSPIDQFTARCGLEALLPHSPRAAPGGPAERTARLAGRSARWRARRTGCRGRSGEVRSAPPHESPAERPISVSGSRAAPASLPDHARRARRNSKSALGRISRSADACGACGDERALRLGMPRWRVAITAPCGGGLPMLLIVDGHHRPTVSTRHEGCASHQVVARCSMSLAPAAERRPLSEGGRCDTRARLAATAPRRAARTVTTPATGRQR